MTMLQSYYMFIEVLMLATIVVCVFHISVELLAARHHFAMTVRLRKVGGLYHWRVGRFGGSFYLSKGR